MKEMISEEDGSMSGTSDFEKNHKRTRDREDMTAIKRIKVETPMEFEVTEVKEEVLEPAENNNMDLLIRGESDAEENEDSLSEMNENSDVSQNSISSSNNNNLDRRKNNIMGEDGQDEGSAGALVLVPEPAQSKQVGIVENGRHVKRTGSSSVTSGGNNRSVETNEDSSGGSTKEIAKPETVLQRFDQEIQDLTNLLVLKEKEWNAVLRLTKLKEIAFAQIQRRKDMKEVLDSPFPSDGGADFMKKLLLQIGEQSHKAGADEAHVRNSIIEVEKEVMELGKQVSNNRIHSDIAGKGETDAASGSDSSQVDSFFLASNALKSLVSRNKATLMSHSIPTASATSTAAAAAAAASTTTPGNIIGLGRQGPIVEVASLIADYRSKSQTDPLDKTQSGKRPLTPGAASSFVINMSPNSNYTDVLTRFKKLADKEKEKDSNCSTTTNTVTNNKTALASKKSSGNTNSSNASGSGKSSVGTTLAKLLSSNSTGAGSRNVDDTTFSNKSVTNNLTSSDKNLSLANLLASAKSRDDPQKKKENQTVPLCQGCNANKAQFVCAGCANQWYCSRECQVAAWDEHSDICSG